MGSGQNNILGSGQNNKWVVVKITYGYWTK